MEDEGHADGLLDLGSVDAAGEPASRLRQITALARPDFIKIAPPPSRLRRLTALGRRFRTISALNCLGLGGVAPDAASAIEQEVGGSGGQPKTTNKYARRPGSHKAIVVSVARSVLCFRSMASLSGGSADLRGAPMHRKEVP